MSKKTEQDIIAESIESFLHVAESDVVREVEPFHNYQTTLKAAGYKYKKTKLIGSTTKDSYPTLLHRYSSDDPKMPHIDVEEHRSRGHQWHVHSGVRQVSGKDDADLKAHLEDLGNRKKSA